jgi:hypothetical protein
VTAKAQGNIISPEVIHTGTGPTGYEVTFRYYDPGAARLRIRGEWFFSDAANTTLHSSAGWLSSQWIPGAFPIAYLNNSYEPNWPVQDMILDPATGIWSFTTPLPSGTYTYGFYINCDAAAPALNGCRQRYPTPTTRPGTPAAQLSQPARCTCRLTPISGPWIPPGRRPTQILARSPM